MHLPARLFLFAPLAVLALSACGKKDDGNAAQAAGGEVLPGTVSDSMINLDTSTSEPPLQPVQPSAGAKTAKAPADDASGAADEPEAEAPAPAAAPAAASPPPPAN
ncbi:hypothetical protein [Novosphingobium olei]|uniref:hypothetical protein n=1 Tax=Novosphingobium olei TaxID=2728851 RepID=UPI003089AD66|nr:hypothetical protein NSDW_34800 [Novosphingobium olei]